MTLFDGSIVRLYPKSKLSFSHGSFSKKREVYLTGQAFFEVKKNPLVPFVVYTRDIVIKVLGTSFNVEAYHHGKQACVKVREGKVSVYQKENFSDKNGIANKLDGLIVIPNQQVIYDVGNHQLKKTIIDKPVAVATHSRERFVFNSTPLKEILKILQDTYGILIIWDESITSACSLSISMRNKNFYEKLESICKAINASYESIDGTIVISSKGCK
jgi:ferric-dicitrate binding protein FerR (iron transport regulator)